MELINGQHQTGWRHRPETVFCARHHEDLSSANRSRALIVFTQPRTRRHEAHNGRDGRARLKHGAGCKKDCTQAGTAPRAWRNQDSASTAGNTPVPAHGTEKIWNVAIPDFDNKASAARYEATLPCGEVGTRLQDVVAVQGLDLRDAFEDKAQKGPGGGEVGRMIPPATTKSLNGTSSQNRDRTNAPELEAAPEKPPCSYPHTRQFLIDLPNAISFAATCRAAAFNPR